MKIRTLFIVSLFFHAAFVLSLTANIITVFVVLPCHKADSTERNGSYKHNCLYDDLRDYWADFFRYLTLCFGALSAVKEFFQLLQSPIEYVHNPENCAQFFLIAGIILFFFILNPSILHNHLALEFNSWQLLHLFSSTK